MLHFRRIAMGAAGLLAPGINTDNYLTIEALEDGMTVSLSRNACEYCIDGSGDWIALPAATATPAVNTGQTLSFRGNIQPNQTNGSGTFTVTKNCNLSGNMLSLIYGNNASGQNVPAYAFQRLFIRCDKLISVSDNVLQANEIGQYGCYATFNSCTNLLRAPEVRATTIYNNGCQYMFQGCTSMKIAGKIYANIVDDFACSGMYDGCIALDEFQGELLPISQEPRCYEYMFRNTKITTISILAETSALESMRCMLYGCSNLNYIKCLLVNRPDLTDTYEWVNGVSATGTFVKNAAAKWKVTGVDGIPEGWTVEVAES